MTGFGILARWVHLACGLGLVGLVTAMGLAGRSDRPTALAWESRMLRWARALAALLLLSGVAALAFQAAVATGRPRAALDVGEWIRLLGQSQFGTVWLVRHGVLLLLTALLLLREREQTGADRLAFRLEAWLLAAAAAGAMAWAGHAAAVEPDGLAAALLDALHLLAAGAWFGALLPLGALLRQTSNERGADARPFAVVAVRAFSRLALVVMTLVVLTGLANTWFQVGSLPALVGTRYGWLLLLKVALLIPILALAQHNRRGLLPRLSGDGATIGRPAMARLGRFVAVEAGLGLLILLITTGLSLSPPAAHDPVWWPFSHRYSWEVAVSIPGGATAVLIGSQMAVIGFLAVIVGLLIRSRRGLFLGAGAGAIAVGLWIALPPMTVDAYPTTYRRSTVPYQAVSVASGAALYHTHCATCHGVGGRGDGPGGAGLPKPPADLAAVHTAQHTAGDMFWWITHGIPAGGMPPFGSVLSEEDRWDLINFIRTLAAGERARQMTALVQAGRPWLVAPDLTIVVGPAPPRTLKELRDRWMTLLVFFTLPESRARLVQLAEAYNTLQALGTEVVAVPLDDGTDIIRRLGRRLGARPPMLFPVVTDGAADIATTYGLLARALAPASRSAHGAASLHAEFLVDRQGYIRARWLPGAAGAGWDTMQTLVDQILILDKETPAGSAPDEHVH
ncbi:MAG TPA: CopD family protein [Candidatus Nitrosotalea sp.]|nr:CopD family protein [Candidatus Nitrosotalea sp.]